MHKNLLRIEIIRECIENDRVYWTKHCLNRIQQRKIKMADVKRAMYNGKIIEYYYDDYPYPSCLILGYGVMNRIIHIVCGISNKNIYMITAYYPDSDKWEDDMKTRREKQ